MKKLYLKDKKTRLKKKFFDVDFFVKKNIISNTNIIKTIKWNTTCEFNNFFKKASHTKLNQWCQETYNKKRVNKNSYYSRHKFFKFIREARVYGATKSYW